MVKGVIHGDIQSCSYRHCLILKADFNSLRGYSQGKFRELAFYGINLKKS